MRTGSHSVGQKRTDERRLIRRHPWATAIIATLLVIFVVRTATGANDPVLHDIGLPTLHPCIGAAATYGTKSDTHCGDSAKAWCRRGGLLAALHRDDCL